jgi:hypothetical protein
MGGYSAKRWVMWLTRLRKLFSGKKPAVEQSDFEKMRDALRPSQMRSNPPKPLTPPPKIERRVK